LELKANNMVKMMAKMMLRRSRLPPLRRCVQGDPGAFKDINQDDDYAAQQKHEVKPRPEIRPGGRTPIPETGCLEIEDMPISQQATSTQRSRGRRSLADRDTSKAFKSTRWKQMMM